ncbi:hypothetical protein LEP1GSC041_3932 [Leptospira noguchii str. 2006001870]|nr:hypothetical protein LEP1GSC041_3932 [Leptospira noguchii str. 2006001870]
MNSSLSAIFENFYLRKIAYSFLLAFLFVQVVIYITDLKYSFLSLVLEFITDP